MSKFTSGFETLHLPRGNLRGGSKRNVRTKSNMFDSKTSKLSGSTRSLVEKLAKQAGLSKRQMRKLGDMSSKDYKPTKPVVQRRVPTTKRLTLTSRPLRKPRPIVSDRTREAKDDLKRTGLRARKQAERRERHKQQSQSSYLRQLRVGHRYFDRLDASESATLPDEREEEEEEQEAPTDLSAMFMRITNEIKEREDFMTRMRDLNSLSRDREFQLKGEISERIKELEMLDRLIERNNY